MTEREQADWSMLEVPTLTDEVMKLMKLHGWKVKRDRLGKAGWALGSGWPDLCGVRGSRLVFIELKRQGKDLDPKQIEWRDALCAVPGIEWYLFRPSDLRVGLIGRVLE